MNKLSDECWGTNQWINWKECKSNDEEAVSSVTVRFQQVSVIQRTPLFRRQEPEAAKKPEKPQFSKNPKNNKNDVDDADVFQPEPEPVQEAPIDYHVPRPQSPAGDHQFTEVTIYPNFI